MSILLRTSRRYLNYLYLILRGNVGDACNVFCIDQGLFSSCLCLIRRSRGSSSFLRISKRWMEHRRWSSITSNLPSQRKGASFRKKVQSPKTWSVCPNLKWAYLTGTRLFVSERVPNSSNWGYLLKLYATDYAVIRSIFVALPNQIRMRTEGLRLFYCIQQVCGAKYLPPIDARFD